MVLADPASRFYGLREDQLERRLELARTELDRATMMMVLASFEATIRTDARDRIDSRTKDGVGREFRRQQLEPERERLLDLLEVWERHASINSQTKSTVRSLLKHRHWLAHGRYWTDKSAIKLTPEDAQAVLEDYADALRQLCPDFPR